MEYDQPFSIHACTWCGKMSPVGFSCECGATKLARELAALREQVQHGFKELLHLQDEMLEALKWLVNDGTGSYDCERARGSLTRALHAVDKVKAVVVGKSQGTTTTDREESSR